MDNDKLSNIDLLEIAAYNALTDEGVLVDAIAHRKSVAPSTERWPFRAKLVFELPTKDGVTRRLVVNVDYHEG